MCAFGFLSALKSMLSSGGNFGFIAQNVATIYYVIENSTFGATLTDIQKLFATALIDMYAYISNGSISVDDVARGVSDSQSGMIVVYPYNRKHGTIGISNNSALVNLTLQIESMIFIIDSKIPPREILDLVVSKKESIASMVNKTLSQGVNSPIYKSVFQTTNTHLQNPDFRYIVSLFDSFNGE